MDCPVCDRILTNITEIGGIPSSIATGPNGWSDQNRALARSGRNPDFGAGKSVTQLMEGLFGPIPDECRSQSSATIADTEPPAVSILFPMNGSQIQL